MKITESNKITVKCEKWDNSAQCAIDFALKFVCVNSILISAEKGEKNFSTIQKTFWEWQSSCDLVIFVLFSRKTFNKAFITRPNCALDTSTILRLYVPGFQRQVFKHVKSLSERSKEGKEQKKNKGSVLVAESAYNAQNAQFGLVMCWDVLTVTFFVKS